MSISKREIPATDVIIGEGDFTMTNDVKERMKSLCGATNFSLGLRNSEHAARYVVVVSIQLNLPLFTTEITIKYIIMFELIFSHLKGLNLL